MTPRTPKPLPASEVVREAIRTSGLSIRELARRTEVEVSALSRFMAGKVGISLSTFEKLSHELGLRIVRETPVEAKAPRPTGTPGTEAVADTTKTTTGKNRRRTSRS